jgi:hypothetical protein
MEVCNVDVKERIFIETSERMRGSKSTWNSVSASNQIHLNDVLFDTQARVKTEITTVVTN